MLFDLQGLQLSGTTPGAVAPEPMTSVNAKPSSSFAGAAAVSAADAATAANNAVESGDQLLASMTGKSLGKDRV
jgi:hypothetical protein